MRHRNGPAAIVAALGMIGLLALPEAALAAPRCFGKRATIVGTGRNDKLKGTSHRDVIVGLGGHDRIVGRAGDDLICGGGGRDFIRGKAGSDRLAGGGKRDRLFGQLGNDRLAGGGGADTLIAVAGDDTLLGGPGGDGFMLPGTGNDIVAGGAGLFDLVSFEKAPIGVVVDLNVVTPQNTNEGVDTITGVEGVNGSGANDRITGQNVPSETGNGLFGLDGTDEILGLDGDDVIDGGTGSDRGGPGVGLLNGGAGHDLVIGGPGDDDLLGESGNDLLDGFEDEETTGDFGSGGPDTDRCFGIETFDPDPANACETMDTRRAPSGPARWNDVL
jgi:Ca2+-binding RTX toxin-like protein